MQEIRVSVKGHLQRNFLTKRERAVDGHGKRQMHLPCRHLVNAKQRRHISDLWILPLKFEDLKLRPVGSNLYWIRPQPVAGNSVPKTKTEAFSDES